MNLLKNMNENRPKKRLVSINRFVRKKNIELAIQAFALMLENKKSGLSPESLQLLIAGIHKVFVEYE
jgi:glycosyltransferase involved in cell wall biosynthesis